MQIKLRDFLAILVVFMLCWFNQAKAQEISYTDDLAPNISLTDIDGESYELYEILSTGKHVIIDFFATWCGPCWDYHEAGHLQNIWETYGPNGTDEVMIFYAEADAGTDYNDLIVNAYGNYLGNTPYPVMDDYHLGNIFKIEQFPTVFFICPEKRMSAMGQIGFQNFEALLSSSCTTPKQKDNLELLFFTNDMSPACQTQEVIPTVMVQNVGTNIVKEISCQFYMNETPIGPPSNWDVWLDTYETQELTFGPFNVASTTNFLVEITEVNSEQDPDIIGNVTSANKAWPISESPELFLEINTDNWGGETHWELWDENGFLYASGDNYTSNANHLEYINLVNLGCYEFKMFDRYGDGMCCLQSDGGYVLKNSLGDILLEGSSFLTEDVGFFEYGFYAVAVDSELTANPEINIYPNPASNQLQIDLLDFQEEVDIVIRDTRGQTLYKQSYTENRPIDVSQFTAGLYYVSVYSATDAFSSSFVVQR